MSKFISRNLVFIRSAVFCILLSSQMMSASATVVLPALLSDNMVLQQNVPVHIWGTASAGEKIVVSILGQTKQTITDQRGKWQLWLDPLSSRAAVKMVVSGTNSITINNILLGEVWFASGQSNMEWDVSQSANSEVEIANANYPDIRIFEAEKSISDTLRSEIRGKWVVCTPETIRKITAAGYFFSRGIHKHLKVPVGLIEASWGATRCEAWTPAEMLKSDPRLEYWERKWEGQVKGFAKVKEDYERKLESWAKEVKEAEAANTPPPAKPAEPQLLNKTKPSSIYNAVVAPISNYTIRGVIWYQGENNAYKSEAFAYRYLFPAMIQGWRNAWKQSDFPFIFAQLSTLNKHDYWPVLRESQTETLKLSNTGMAVTYDIGDSTDAHYKNKQEVGRRLELVARNLVYGENIESSGPLLRQITLEGSAIRVWFKHGKGLKASDGTVLTGFEIAGEDGHLYPARAVAEGETVLLSHPKVLNPVIARYAFKDAVVANLINSSGLPAVPFRTDIKNGL